MTGFTCPVEEINAENIIFGVLLSERE